MAIWRQVFILMLLAGFGYGGFIFYEQHSGAAEAPQGAGASRAASVEIATAAVMTLARNVEAVGTTRARQSVEIRPVTSGRVVELAISPGDQVEAGAVLARLDDEIQSADLTEATALVEEQRRSTERAEQLRRTNAIAATTLEQAIARRAVAEATLNRVRRRLDDRTIRAPFAGHVGLTDIDLGAQVDEDTVLTRLDDLSEIEIEFSLPETLFAEIRTGMPIAATGAAFRNRVFNGEVSAIDSRIDRLGRSFKVRATIPNPEAELPAGMFMSLSLTLSATESLVAPEEAIVAQAADTYVFVVKDEIAVRRSVVTGLRKGGVVAILSGLEPGEIVVTRGLQSVRDGGAVNVVGAAPPLESEPKS
ncbi:MAG: efflux RND transporter periplasmic adaptor subunit [Paracoccaceae bacterium]